jgi:DNA-binding beta-propeller fold protein YncE
MAVQQRISPGIRSASHEVAVDPTDKYAYVANQADNSVSAYTVNPTSGALTPIAGSPFPAGAGASNIAITEPGVIGLHKHKKQTLHKLIR